MALNTITLHPLINKKSLNIL